MGQTAERVGREARFFPPALLFSSPLLDRPTAARRLAGMVSCADVAVVGVIAALLPGLAVRWGKMVVDGDGGDWAVVVAAGGLLLLGLVTVGGAIACACACARAVTRPLASRAGRRWLAGGMAAVAILPLPVATLGAAAAAAAAVFWRVPGLVGLKTGVVAAAAVAGGGGGVVPQDLRVAATGVALIGFSGLVWRWWRMEEEEGRGGERID